MRIKLPAGSIIAACLSLLLISVLPAVSAEHPGGAMEHPGAAVQPSKSKPITASFVKKSIEEHVKTNARQGVFTLHDDKLNKDWRLKLAKVHDPVRMFQKDGQTIYFACSDFNSIEGKDVLDIDFWMVEKGGMLQVIDTKIHKLNGEPRYQYEGVDIKEIK